jgi:hypothetical protein
LFLQADLSVSLDPLPSRTCLYNTSSADISTSTHPYASSFELAFSAAVTSSVCWLPLPVTTDLNQFTTLLCEARTQLDNLRQIVWFVTLCSLALFTFMVITACIGAPPLFSAYHILWLCGIIIPFIASSFLATPSAPRLMQRHHAKDDARRLEPEEIGSSWLCPRSAPRCSALRVLPIMVVYALVCYGLLHSVLQQRFSIHVETGDFSVNEVNGVWARYYWGLYQQPLTASINASLSNSPVLNNTGLLAAQTVFSAALSVVQAGGLILLVGFFIILSVGFSNRSTSSCSRDRVPCLNMAWLIIVSTCIFAQLGFSILCVLLSEPQLLGYSSASSEEFDSRVASETVDSVIRHFFELDGSWHFVGTGTTAGDVSGSIWTLLLFLIWSCIELVLAEVIKARFDLVTEEQETTSAKFLFETVLGEHSPK